MTAPLVAASAARQSAPTQATSAAPAIGLPQPFSTFLSPLTLRLRDITSFQLPRLAASSSSTITSSSAPVLFASYEAELLAALAECRDLIEEGQYLLHDLSHQVGFEQGGREQVQLMQGEWKRVKDQFENTKTSSQIALLQGRRTLADRKKRGLLTDKDTQQSGSASLNPATAAVASSNVGGSKSQTTRRTNAMGEDEALLASEDLTSALRQTVGLLSDSLTQSAFSAELLEESTLTLSTLSFDYTTFSDLVKNSGGILKSMERQDKIDALMLLGAYLFFFFCIGYILKVRIWDKGVSFFAFLFRLVGLGRGGSLSATEIKEKMQLAGEAAKSRSAEKVSASSRHIAAEVIAAVSTTLVGRVSSALPGSPIQGKAQQAAPPLPPVEKQSESPQVTSDIDEKEVHEEGFEGGQPQAQDIHIEIQDRKPILYHLDQLVVPLKEEARATGADVIEIAMDGAEVLAGGTEVSNDNDQEERGNVDQIRNEGDVDEVMTEDDGAFYDAQDVPPPSRLHEEL